MNTLGHRRHKDGFCRAPRLEVVASNSNERVDSFDELVRMASFQKKERLSKDAALAE